MRNDEQTRKFGGVAEWSIAPVLKTGDPQGSVGSNPTSSAHITIGMVAVWFVPSTRPSEAEVRVREWNSL